MLTAKLADSKNDIDEAIGLITRVYARSGYVHKDTGEASGISEHLYSPATRTFTIRMGDLLLGTLSVIADSAEGLPMQVIFSDELNALRREGKRIAEVGQFAIDKELLAEAQKRHSRDPIDRAIALSLFKLALHYGVRKEFDLFCIAVNPKHVAFYRWMGFETFGATKTYPSVENAPAVPMKIDLGQLVEDRKNGKSLNAVLTEIFNNPPDESVLAAALETVNPSLWARLREVPLEILNNILHGEYLN